jgi:hypothetical protein
LLFRCSFFGKKKRKKKKKRREHYRVKVVFQLFGERRARAPLNSLYIAMICYCYTGELKKKKSGGG